MFEVLIAEKSVKLESDVKRAGFSKAFFISGDKFKLIDTEDKEDLRKEISRASSKGQKIIVIGSSDVVNRIALEDERVSVLLNPEEYRLKDYMKYRNSGLNHVLCKLAAKNKIGIGISWDSLKKAKSKERAERLGRIMQNIALCRKYGAKIILASFGEEVSSPYALRSFGLVAGMSTQQAKESLESASGFLG